MRNKVTAPGHCGITGVHFPQGFPKTCCCPSPDLGQEGEELPLQPELCENPRPPRVPAVQTHSGTRQRARLQRRETAGSFQPIPTAARPGCPPSFPQGLRGAGLQRGGVRRAAAPPGPRTCRAAPGREPGGSGGSGGCRRPRAGRFGAGTHRGGGRGRFGLREPVGGGGAVGAARGEQPGRRGRAGAGGQPGVGAVEPGIAPLPHVREVGHLPQAEPPHHGRAAGACPGPAPARAALPAPAAPGRRRRAGRPRGRGGATAAAGRARVPPVSHLCPVSHPCPRTPSVSHFCLPVPVVSLYPSGVPPLSPCPSGVPLSQSHLCPCIPAVSPSSGLSPSPRCPHPSPSCSSLAAAQNQTREGGGVADTG